MEKRVEQENQTTMITKLTESMLFQQEEVTDYALLRKSVSYLDVDFNNFTLRELKLMDLYGCHINPKNPKQNIVFFTKEELAKVFGIKQIRPEEFYEMLNSLTASVRIYDGEQNIAVREALFGLCECPDQNGVLDEKRGIGLFGLRATAFGKQYFFNLDANNPYFRTHIKALMQIQHKYSYLLALYLSKQDSIHRRKWTIGVAELKRILGCDTFEGESNNIDVKHFNDQVVKPSFKEVNEKMDMSVTYKYRAGSYTIEITERLPEHREQNQEGLPEQDAENGLVQEEAEREEA